ncbi:MAG: tripartite tricarboxylate transporter substrate binding protein [Armatimonadota bacterium]|nr:tripartite tricarboxylate transporter substrate binding protein [Armatimonadota bacterium]MDR7518982.1 tripartite tricarboxylate transporter substrate binding protein [Armatimonadota bacterium]MDR7548899.1 tripartite tricarboxylate transporter substrate binding protein [Armatimonadota bacterium]
MKRTRSLAAAVLLVTVFSGGAGGAPGPVWPENRPVTIVVPFAAGGGTDLIARQLQRAMQRFIEVPIVIRNIPGAGSGIGSNEVLRARPDGHTLLLSGTHTVTATLQGLAAGSIIQFDHIASLNWDAFVIAVLDSSPYQTLKDLIDAGKQNPGKITIGHAGVGALTHLTAEALNKAAGSPWTVVPFEGGARLIAGVLGNVVTAGVFSQSEVQAQAGRLRPLAVTSLRRTPLFPQTPTVEELGFKNIPQGSFRSISGPKGIPMETRRAIAAAVGRAMNDPEWIAYSRANGLVKIYLTNEELERYIAVLTLDLSKLLRQVGLMR